MALIPRKAHYPLPSLEEKNWKKEVGEFGLSVADYLRRLINQLDKSYEDIYRGFLKSGYSSRANIAAWDYTQANLTTDATYRNLDLSNIVPQGAKSAEFYIQLKDDAVGSQFVLKSENDANFNVISQVTQVANTWIMLNGLVVMNSNRIVQYYASNTTWSNINIVIRGWIS